MGCCVSTSTPLKQQQKEKQQHRHSSSGYSGGCGRKAAPSPPLMEEEAVKEVLSETPAPKPPPPSKVEKQINTPPTPKLALKKVEEEEKIYEKVPVCAVEEISEISEICSMTESVSTTTITERRDDDDRSRDECEVRQRVVRSPARLQSNPRTLSGDLGGKRGRGVRKKSPARRLEPSPGKGRSVSAREGSQSTARQTDGRRRESGENGARRSRSPATRAADNAASRSGIGRSPSARKTGQSPSSVPAAGSSRNVEQTEKEGKWPPPSPPAPTNESLENPLVSLECFIFL